MITYKFFRDKFFVLSDKPYLSPLKKNNIKQLGFKPNGLWFSKGLQWFNLVLNSHHRLYDDKNPYTPYTRKQLYLIQLDINWDNIFMINNEQAAMQISEDFIRNRKIFTWDAFTARYPDIHGVFFELNDKYNIETRSRRTHYRENSERLETKNLEIFTKKLEEHLIKHVPNEYNNFVSKYKDLKLIHTMIYMWYPVLSISSGCIWNNDAINFDKCKLVLTIPETILIECKHSTNSIDKLIKYINDNNLITDDADNSTYVLSPLNNMLYQNSNRRTKRRGIFSRVFRSMKKLSKKIKSMRRS
jgi:hypothetical protein